MRKDSGTLSCVFCDIVSQKSGADILYENQRFVSFKDSNPVAPVHFLVVPKKHISCMDDVTSEDMDIIYEVFINIPILCNKFGILGAYRIVNNCGRQAGQTVNHLHFHILGGRKFNWPPG